MKSTLFSTFFFSNILLLSANHTQTTLSAKMQSGGGQKNILASFNVMKLRSRNDVQERTAQLVSFKCKVL
jgi:hypothetical protein